GISSGKICVENNEGIPFSTTYDVLLDEFRDMRICLDIGHLILQGDEQPADFVKRWKNRVGEIHFHNVLYKKIGNRIHSYDDHHGIVRGVLDVISFLNFLESINFKAPVLLEITTQKEIVESIAFLRENGFL
nr:TIM barrel protein [Candidatus Sigynarchaeota archaeon]